MQYVNLGATGLRVSRVCLGMMSFGNDSDRPWVLDEDAAEPIVQRGGRGRHHLLRHRRHLLGRRQRGRHRPPARASSLSRDEVVVATKVFMPMTPGRERRRPVAQAHPRGDRRVARAAGDGLRRPVPDPPLGRPHADRGDDGGAARRRAGRQGPLHRRQQHVRLAVRQGPARRRRATAGRGSCRCRTTTT